MNAKPLHLIWSRLGQTLALAALFTLGGLFLAACDVDSVDSTTAVPSDGSGTIYNFAGLYARVDTNGMQAPLVFPLGRQSGTTITWLRLLQYGSRIEAYDNAGMTWAGSISTIDGGTAKFSLRGRTTAGLSTEIAGALRYANQSSTMDAAWIEPAFSGSIFATATVSPAATNNPIGGNVTLQASSTSVASNGTVTFVASGGSSYSWSLNTTQYGALSHNTNHSTNSFTRTSGIAGNTVKVTVSSGTDSDSVTLTFN
jgi:hypothetical protein